MYPGLEHIMYFHSSKGARAIEVLLYLLPKQLRVYHNAKLTSSRRHSVMIKHVSTTGTVGSRYLELKGTL